MHKTRRKYRFIQWRLWGFSGKKQCFVILILLQCKWAFYSGAAWLVNEPHNWCSLKCRGSDHFTSIQIHSAHSKHHRELGSLLPQTNVLSRAIQLGVIWAEMGGKLAIEAVRIRIMRPWWPAWWACHCGLNICIMQRIELFNSILWKKSFAEKRESIYKILLFSLS